MDDDEYISGINGIGVFDVNIIVANFFILVDVTKYSLS
jgi:hypothetical protein